MGLLRVRIDHCPQQSNAQNDSQGQFDHYSLYSRKMEELPVVTLCTQYFLLQIITDYGSVDSTKIPLMGFIL
jgi:hypothetical protein